MKIPANYQIPSNIFRMYDIRGVVETDLTSEAVYLIGKALGAELRQQQQNKIVIGRDGRLTGEAFLDALTQGLLESGVDVIDIGEVPTPLVYFAYHELPGVNSCAMITGSHNPTNYNGIKMVINGVTLFGEHIQKLLKRIQNNDFVAQNLPHAQNAFQKPEDKPCLVIKKDIFDDYKGKIEADIQLKRSLKVVVDSGNGVPGAFAPEVLRAIGCEVVEIYCDVDGNFPNHHPDPAKLENLRDLIEKVKAEKADLGLAFDGDGDRCGVVDELGNVLYPDRQIMLYALDILKRQPGAEIIYDIKSSALLAKLVEQAGGKATIWKTGHSFMKAKMKETGAALGGEVSGHMFFKERWYGFDDGIYTAARLCEIIAKQDKAASEVFSTLPDAYNTPEIDIKFAEGEHFIFMEKFIQQADFGEADIVDLDGLRVTFEDGWGLIRGSNTTPVLVLRFEAETPEALQRIIHTFKTELKKVGLSEDKLALF